MTEAETSLEIIETSGDDDGEMHHIFCCDPDYALCGTNVEDETFRPAPRPQDSPCVVCEELDKIECPTCGL